MPAVIKFVAAYFAVAWLVAFVAGLFFGTRDTDSDVVTTISLLWPLSIPATLLFMSAMFIEDFIVNRPRLKRVLSKTGRIIGSVFTAFLQLIGYATLIFRPYKLGLVIRSMFKRRRGS